MKIDDALKTRGVPVAYRSPFAVGQCWVDERPHGQSILEIVKSVPNLPRDFWTHGVVQINGEIVPKELWPHIRPKPTSAELPIAVTLHRTLGAPGGGGGSGSTAKSVIGLVAALALVIVTAGLASGVLLPVLGLQALAAPVFLGITGGQILAGVVGIAGALAISALTAPPTAPLDAGATTASDVSNTNTDSKESAAASGNVLDRGGAIPRVLGTRKIFPPLACEPVVELIGEDEFVEALFILNGPHLIEDIRVGNVAVDDSDDIEVETREGWEADTPLTSITRQGRTLTPQLELSVHKVAADNAQALANPSTPERDLPVWHGLVSRNQPDEIWLHLTLPSGLSAAGSANEVVIPFRMRMRMRGDSAWINLPEFHLAGATLQQLRRQVLFKWKGSEPLQSPPSSNGFYLARTFAPAQTAAVGGVTDAWIAHSHFLAASGDSYLVSGNQSTTGLQNMNLIDNRVEFYLDEDTFPKGIYEFQIKRGATYARASFSHTAYTYGGLVQDFFSYNTVSFGVPTIVFTRANLADRVIAIRFVSIWNERPVQSQGFALMALKARNRSLQQMSVQASGYVRDWDGSAWADWTTTSNPAPHYVDILSGQQNLDPLPDDLRDDTTFVAWRTECDTEGHQVNAVINDERTQDVLQKIASWGYARPYQSDVYSVVMDRDRTGDVPVQVFSRRNSANMRTEIAFPRLPAGFNVTYRDDAEDDDAAQLTVYQRDLTNVDLTLLESVSYDGNTDAEAVRRRAQFDIDQATFRNVFYAIDTDIESIVCRRGDLVALQHDVLTSRAGDGYIATIQRSGGSPNMITGVTLDSEIPFSSMLDMHAITDMHLVDDMHEVGRLTGIAIRHTDGTITTHQISSASGNALTLTTPFFDDPTIQSFADNDHKYGCMVVAGELDSEYRRLLVHTITPSADLKASITLVDEAPELFTEVVTSSGLVLMDGATPMVRMDDTTALELMS